MKIELPIPKEMSTERYFEIRDIDSKGCGSYGTVCITGDTPTEEIGKIVSEYWTEKKVQEEDRYIPSFFKQPPEWRNTIKVVENQRKIKPLTEINRWGKDYENEWSTKRGGLKFTIENNYFRIKMSNGQIREGNGYQFGRILSK